MKIKPLGERVLVEPIKEDEVAKGGIIINKISITDPNSCCNAGLINLVKFSATTYYLRILDHSFNRLLTSSKNFYSSSSSGKSSCIISL